MKEEADLIRYTVKVLVQKTAGQLHREGYYTTRLFAKLWPFFGERLLCTTGLDVKFIIDQFSRNGAKEFENLRGTHLEKTYDYYADLILTAPLGDTTLKNTLSLDEVLKHVQITHLYEFKYLTAFTSLSGAVARDDTYKLKVLGEYIRLSCGIRPHMEQFIVLSDRKDKKKVPPSLDKIRRWFDEADFQEKTEGVIVSIVDADGETIHTIDK